MRRYFDEMTPLGKALTEKQIKDAQENIADIKKVEAEVAKAVEVVKSQGIPDAKIKERGQMTVWERIEYLVDPGTWTPLHTIYNPKFNEEEQTNVVDGLAKINGKWAVVIGFNNKVMAGAWIAGQADNQLRVTDMAKRLRVPLVWIVNCSGVKLPEQEEVYADRRGNGTTFFRHAELAIIGIPSVASSACLKNVVPFPLLFAYTSSCSGSLTPLQFTIHTSGILSLLAMSVTLSWLSACPAIHAPAITLLLNPITTAHFPLIFARPSTTLVCSSSLNFGL